MIVACSSKPNAIKAYQTNALSVYIMVAIFSAYETLSLLVLGCLHRCSERT